MSEDRNVGGWGDMLASLRKMCPEMGWDLDVQIGVAPGLLHASKFSDPDDETQMRADMCNIMMASGIYFPAEMLPPDAPGKVP